MVTKACDRGQHVAHVLALDYALRPVLQSLDPRLVVGGQFGTFAFLDPRASRELETAHRRLLNTHLEKELK